MYMNWFYSFTILHFSITLMPAVSHKDRVLQTGQMAGWYVSLSLIFVFQDCFLGCQKVKINWHNHFLIIHDSSATLFLMKYTVQW